MATRECDEPSIRSARARAGRGPWIGAALGVLLAAPAPAYADEARAVPVAVLPIKLLDTSGEPTDQTAEHAGRLLRMGEDLSADLTRTGAYRAVYWPAARLARSCPAETAACLLQAAREQEADLVFIGVVHKSSTLILQLWARLVDVRSGRDVFLRDLNFRGDTDEAWQRARAFLAAQIREAGSRR